jgi:MATE family multidrug resistance protein
VYGTLAETIVNIVLDYGLIFGHLGLPALGFNGAAVSSIFAEASGMIVVFIVIGAGGISRDLQLYHRRRPDRQTVLLILRQSSPLVFQNVISITAWIFFYILIEHQGRQALAISNTMRNIFGLFGIFTWAFASTTNAMVSNIIGQGLQDQVQSLIGKILRLGVGLAILEGILLNVAPGIFLSVYGQDSSFMTAAIPVVRVVSSALVMMSFSIIWLNAVTGTGNSRITLFIECITITLYCLYVYLVVERWQLSLVAAWMSEWLYWLSLFSMSYAYIRSGRWKGKVI